MITREKLLIGKSLRAFAFIWMCLDFTSCDKVKDLIPEPKEEAEARVVKTQNDLIVISSALAFYKIRFDRYPTTEQGLQALVTKPTVDPIPDNWVQAMEEIPTDGWNQSYKYRCSSKLADKPYDLYSIGKNGIDEGGAGDDIAK